ncbi:MAG: hypothetical protein RLZZ450_5248 [Pseudomonadota bacterium]|jgi:hypothetical protein
MHELPPDADEVLTHARLAQSEPDEAVRDRVRRRVASALLVGAGVGATTTAAAQLGASSTWSGALAAKIFAGAAICAVALGVALTPRLEGAPARTAPSAARAAAPGAAATRADVEPVIAAAPAPTQDGDKREVVAVVASEVAARPVVTPHHRALKPEAPASLLVELGLLEQAERALERDDSELALQVLARHRKAFEHSSFVDERDGLTLIARCTLEPGAAADDAREFLTRARRSVLHERVATACRGAR